MIILDPPVRIPRWLQASSTAYLKMVGVCVWPNKSGSPALLLKGS